MLDRQLISEEGMFLWLMRGVLKADAKSDIIAQEWALQTKVMQGKYLKHNNCRCCKLFDEKVECIISACLILAVEK
jgi:Tfp pilus assembly protein PilP